MPVSRTATTTRAGRPSGCPRSARRRSSACSTGSGELVVGREVARARLVGAREVVGLDVRDLRHLPQPAHGLLDREPRVEGQPEPVAVARCAARAPPPASHITREASRSSAAALITTITSSSRARGEAAATPGPLVRGHAQRPSPARRARTAKREAGQRRRTVKSRFASCPESRAASGGVKDGRKRGARPVAREPADEQAEAEQRPRRRAVPASGSSAKGATANVSPFKTACATMQAHQRPGAHAQQPQRQAEHEREHRAVRGRGG